MMVAVLLPVVLWAFAVFGGLAVCAACLSMTRRRRASACSGGAPRVPAVPWGLIVVHVSTVVFAASAYGMALWLSVQGRLPQDIWYVRLGWPSAIAVVACIVGQLCLMYRQARHCWRTTMDARLSGVSRTSLR